MKNRTPKTLKIILACVLSCTLVIVPLTSCASLSNVASLANRATSQQTTGLSASAVRTPQTTTTNSTVGNDKVTVLVYMNGSNLESEGGEATEDLTEMVKAGSSDDVNVIVETLGTSSWEKTYGISSSHTQRYKVTSSGLTLVDDSLGQLDCTDPTTLQDFISWGAANYPADRYELILWDHGGGPVYGYGYDEWQDEDATLTLDEMQQAVAGSGVYFDFIGFDACIMSSIEVCAAMYDYCDYMVLSEDFESGLGWYYTDWLKKLYADPTISTPELGQSIVDGMVNANKNDRESGSDAILSVIDESMMKVLFAAWTDFAYANEDTLLNTNYSTEVEKTGRALPSMRPGGFAGGQGGFSGAGPGGSGQYSGWSDGLYNYIDSTNVSMEDYYITDIMAVASNIDSTESKALSAALAQAIVYTNSTTSDSDLTGLSVTLPYGDSSFYSELSSIFINVGLDSTYVNWLGKFVTAAGSSSYYNYSDWSNSWNGWNSYTEDDDFDWSQFGSSSDSDWEEFVFGMLLGGSGSYGSGSSSSSGSSNGYGSGSSSSSGSSNGYGSGSSSGSGSSNGYGSGSGGNGSGYGGYGYSTGGGGGQSFGGPGSGYGGR